MDALVLELDFDAEAQYFVHLVHIIHTAPVSEQFPFEMPITSLMIRSPAKLTYRTDSLQDAHNIDKSPYPGLHVTRKDLGHNAWSLRLLAVHGKACCSQSHVFVLHHPPLSSETLCNLSVPFKYGLWQRLRGQSD